MEPTSTPTTVQQVLEAALADDPDDLAAHSAYADYLMEQGDPRGEFIQVQLALEDPTRTPAERNELRHREDELLSMYSRQWLGDAGRFLVGKWSGADKPLDYRFARGWLDMVRVLPYPDAAIAALARSPEARLLRHLEVVYDMRYHPFDFDQFTEGPVQALTEEEQASPGAIYEECTIMPPLLASPFLRNLRVFKLGFDRSESYGHSTMVIPFGDCNAQQVIDLLKKCPRLEELYLNTDGLYGIEQLFALPTLDNIRALQYYYGSEYTLPNRTQPAYPLSVLANNPSLTKLTTLRLHPGRDATIALSELQAILLSPHLPALTHLQVHMTTFGDEGCRPIIESGILKRLKVLDIGYGTLTDGGARTLAACPDLKHLDVLDVTRNGLTEAGIAALRATGIQIVADNQHEGEEDFLYEVDLE